MHLLHQKKCLNIVEEACFCLHLSPAHPSDVLHLPGNGRCVHLSGSAGQRTTCNVSHPNFVTFIHFISLYSILQKPKWRRRLELLQSLDIWIIISICHVALRNSSSVFILHTKGVLFLYNFYAALKLFTSPLLVCETLQRQLPKESPEIKINVKMLFLLHQ